MSKLYIAHNFGSLILPLISYALQILKLHCASGSSNCTLTKEFRKQGILQTFVPMQDTQPHKTDKHEQERICVSFRKLNVVYTYSLSTEII